MAPKSAGLVGSDNNYLLLFLVNYTELLYSNHTELKRRCEMISLNISGDSITAYHTTFTCS